MADPRAELIATLRWQRDGCRALGAPFYAELCDGLVADVSSGGPAWDLLAPHAAATPEDAYVLRLLGGVHRLVLSGGAPELEARYPSVGGDGDARQALPALAALLARRPAEIADALARPPQTNEVGRSAALSSGLLVVARETGLPLRLRELGASGGLNLRPDCYWYEQDGQGWGEPASPVRFVDLWRDGAPPFESAALVRDRRGCDQHPVDPTTDEGTLTLLSYVWPEPMERFTRTREAIAIARAVPAALDRADAATWLHGQLGHDEPGTTLVVLHSIVWQYFDDDTRRAIRNDLARAGATASPQSPLAWLRLEPRPVSYWPAELRLTVWDGRSSEPEDRLLATTTFHLGPIHWLGA